MNPALHSVSIAEAAEIARQQFGIDADVRALPGEYDANFHLVAKAVGASETDEAGGEYVLKLMRPTHPLELLELQCALLRHVEDQLPNHRLPRVQPAKSGEEITRVNCADGELRLAWMLEYIDGSVLARVHPHSDELLRSLGGVLGELDSALATFEHPAAARDFHWDPAQGAWLVAELESGALDPIEDPARKQLVIRICRRFESETLPQLAALRRGTIHADANDYNVIVAPPNEWPRTVRSVIDFGDALETCTVCEPAIAAAYALFGKTRPLDAAAAVVAGYHQAYPLTDEEIAVLFDLITMRLAISVVVSARRRKERPENEYLLTSEAPAWEALERLDTIHPRLAHYTMRAACGKTPVPWEQEVVSWLRTQAERGAGRILKTDLRSEPFTVIDLSVGSLLTGADPAALEEPALTEAIWRQMALDGNTVAYGRWDEPRGLYVGPAFALGDHPTAPHRTIHIGIDLFADVGTAVLAPLDGTVAGLADNVDPYDYGPTVVLRHETDSGRELFTLYGHLTRESIETLALGQAVRAGEELARIGGPPGNGNWSPHLHLQLILDSLDLGTGFAGVALADERQIWKSLCPDPNVLLGIPANRFPPREPTYEDTLARRRRRTGKNLSLSYDQPLKIVRGWKQYLYDETGRCYLDVYNNIPHVGHSHPHVVRAAQSQIALLNTNTRYLHDGLLQYADRLCAKLSDGLEVCYFVNSGSEANELALRLARAATGREGMIVTESAYHGHTNTLIDISPYKFDGPGGLGTKPWVRSVPIPDDYRGPFKRNDPDAGERYAAFVENAAEELADGIGLAGFICETLPSVGGQIVLPPGYLNAAYNHVRKAGGLAIADEVQVGFGRLGTHFWGIETQDAVPDIVVLGKPIANGHPMGAVITTREIADAFANGMEYFASFGGNPVSCAIANAVLDVVEQELLQAHALEVGNHFLGRLRELLDRHSVVGDVRGSGLFLGVELVRDRETLEPADREAGYVVNRLKDSGILCGTDGQFHNVLKIRPPMPFTRDDADFFVEVLDRVLEEDRAQPDQAQPRE